ncbi:MAG: hypothetical protein LBT38_04965 [Deltaproteobacteria bacterium]|jgi:hypothetical protein|nr:hypothetical protein [Deltaproteobacteria bacterium]
MFDLYCPNCRKKLRLIKNPPVTGVIGWVKCPSCGEIFQGQQVDLRDGSFEPRKTLFKNPNSSRHFEEGINGLKATSDHKSRGETSVKGGSQGIQKGLGRDSLQLTCLTINSENEIAFKKPYNQAKVEGRELIALNDCHPVATTKSGSKLVLFCCGFLVLLALGSIGLTAKDQEQPPVVVAKPLTVDYGANFFKGDLLALKEDLGRLGRADKEIAYRGYESRIYKHFLGLLNGQICEDIVLLKIYSDDTSSGLWAKGVCANQGHECSELAITWDGSIAHAQLTGEEKIVEFNTNPVDNSREATNSLNGGGLERASLRQDRLARLNPKDHDSESTLGSER